MTDLSKFPGTEHSVPKKPKKQTCDCGKQPTFPGNVRAVVNGFERITTFKPGFICPLTGGKSHGRHGVDLLFLLSRNNRVIQFLVFTHWSPDCMEKGLFRDAINPMPADLGYHSPTPLYEGQTSGDDCPWIKGDCYYDGSGLNAERPFGIFLTEGEEAMWEYLEGYWTDLFERKEP